MIKNGDAGWIARVLGYALLGFGVACSAGEGDGGGGFSNNHDESGGDAGSQVESGGSTGVGGTKNQAGSTGNGGTKNQGGSTAVGGTKNQAGDSGNGGTKNQAGSASMGGKKNQAGGAGTGGKNLAGGSGTGGKNLAGSAGTGGKNQGGNTGTGGKSGTGGDDSDGGTHQTGGSNREAGAGGDPNDGGSSGFDPCPATGECKVLPFGDSITDGIGFSGGYRVELFTKAVADGKKITFLGRNSNGPANVSGVKFPKSHEGWSGYTIQQIDDMTPQPALSGSPQIVLLHIGTNDMARSASGANNRLESLVDQILTTLPNSLLVVSTIIPLPSAASAVNSYNAAIPAMVQKRASQGKHILFVDQFKGFPSSELGDGVHPNQAGYARMAGVWYGAIKDYLH